MKKKNVLVMALSLALIAVIAVSGTLAYFTDKTDAKVNTFTTGKVDIELHDESNDQHASIHANGLYYSEIVPGDSLNKEVYVTVKELSSASRVAIRLAFDNLSNTEFPRVNEMKELVYAAMENAGTTNDWTCYPAEDGTEDLIFVAKNVTENQSTDVQTLKLFDTIKIPASWGNAYADAAFSITASAYAIQADNVDEATFVKMINGQPITVDGIEQKVEFEQVR